MLQTENLDRKENIICRENFNCSLNPKLDNCTKENVNR